LKLLNGHWCGFQTQKGQPDNSGKVGEMTALSGEANHRAKPNDKPGRPAGKLTTLRISCTRMNVELINNERKAKKPEKWEDQARRVRLMRGLGVNF